MKNSKHKEWQKYSERFALNILTDELMIPRENVLESEGPELLSDICDETYPFEE